MPDISMCTGNMHGSTTEEKQLCPQRHNCYRFLATPNPDWQSYLIADLTQIGKCEHYWEVLNEVR